MYASFALLYNCQSFCPSCYHLSLYCKKWLIFLLPKKYNFICLIWILFIDVYWKNYGYLSLVSYLICSHLPPSLLVFFPWIRANLSDFMILHGKGIDGWVFFFENSDRNIYSMKCSISRAKIRLSISALEDKSCIKFKQNQ